MSTRIVFTDGAHITVIEDAENVKDQLTEDKLGSGEVFRRFEAQGGRSVYIAADQVAYLEQRSSIASG
jgi:hypothetical protein